MRQPPALHVGVTPWHDVTTLAAASIAAQAGRAEALGFRSFWLPENHFGAGALPEPLLLLAAAAAGSRHLRLATTSFLITLRHPLQAAEQVAVLDRLAGGRLILGLGRGYRRDVLDAFGVTPTDKRRVFERTLDVMRRAWSGAALDGSGGGAVLSPLPLQQPHPPLWMAAFGPLALAQAGRLQLPYLASPVEAVEALQTNYAQVHAAAAAAGVAAAPEVPVMRTVFVTANGRRARRVAEALAALRSAAVVPAPQSTSAAPPFLVGEGARLGDAVAALRERLGMTHLVVTRPRIDGLEPRWLDASVEAVAEALDLAPAAAAGSPPEEEIVSQ